MKRTLTENLNIVSQALSEGGPETIVRTISSGEVDCSDVDLCVVAMDEYSHFIRTILRNGEITSMELFYNYGGPEKFYK